MWKKADCAVQGRGHIANNIPCQDKTYCFSSNGVEVIALADGAGSAKYSHFGAEAAVKTTTNLLSENFDQLFNSSPNNFKMALLNGIQKELDLISQERHCNLTDLASTLLMVAIKDNRYLIAHLGDGVIGYIKNNLVCVASEPQNGEFANTTIFTTSKQAPQSLKILRGYLNDISGFILMSDGSENSLYDKRKHSLSIAVKDLFYFNTLFPGSIFKSQLEDDVKQIIRNMTNDDCSLAIINRCDGATLSKYFAASSLDDKIKLFQLNNNMHNLKSRKRAQRFESILQLLADAPLSLHALSRAIHLKLLYTKKRMAHLEQLQLVNYSNGKYYLAD